MSFPKPDVLRTAMKRAWSRSGLKANAPRARGVASHAHSFHAEQISVLRSDVDVSSAEFRDNQLAMDERIQQLRELRAQIAKGGGAKASEKHLARGKMLVRDRITALIDPSTPFLELSPFAGHGVYPDTPALPAGGLVTGIGTVSGVTCMIVANDATVKGGTYYPITVKKHLRAQEIAAENRLPCIYLSDSGGANLPHQADVFPDREHFGRIFRNQARLSAARIPQIAVAMGPCTAGGAYVPAMSDEAVIVRGTGHIFLAGPPLVRAATGEVVSADDLGGAQLHCETSGVADYLAEDDAHALVIVRRSIANLNWPKHAAVSGLPSASSSPFTPPWDEPLYDPAHLAGLVPHNLRTPLPARALLAHLLDGSRFAEFKPLYGPTLLTGFGTIRGQRVGVLLNAGPLMSECALKAAHFIELCSLRRVPLLFLHNVAGFMVGREAEAGGIAKHGAKMVHAVACANVPKISVVVGASYGAGNYGMCGRAFGPRFLWSWPSARVGVMGPEQLAGVMKAVKGEDEGLKERITRETDVLFGSARLWDDGVVEPAMTREYVALGLKAALGGWTESEETNFGVFRM